MFAKKVLVISTVIGVGIVLAAVSIQRNSQSFNSESIFPLSYPESVLSSVAGVHSFNQAADSPSNNESEAEPDNQDPITSPEIQNANQSAQNTSAGTFQRPLFARIAKISDKIISSNSDLYNGTRRLDFSSLIVFSAQNIMDSAILDSSVISWFVQSASLPRTLIAQGNERHNVSYVVPLSACGDSSFKITAVVKDINSGQTAEDSVEEGGFNSICPRPANTTPVVEIFTPTMGQTYYNVPEAYPYEMYPRHCPYYVDIFLSGRITDPLYGQIPDNKMFWSINGGSESAIGNNINYRFCGHWDTPYSYTVVLSYPVTPVNIVDKRVEITILPPQ